MDATRRLPVFEWIARNNPNGGNVNIMARPELIQIDLTNISGVKLTGLWIVDKLFTIYWRLIWEIYRLTG
jgi:hypothetical protein